MLGATVRLVPVAAAPALVVLGYPDMADAADAVPAMLAHAPLAIEGMDSRMVDVVRRRKGPSRVPELPPGDGWLMVEMGADSAAEAVALAQAMVAGAGAIAAAVIPAGPEAAAMWRIREDGAGLGGRTPSDKQAWPGLEDSAVPPDRLGAYLRELRALLGSYQLDGLLYGHFGDGCIHVRLDIPLERRAARRHARVHDRRGAPRRGARRLAVRGARRRPRPLRAAAGDVLARGDGRVRRVQGPARPAPTCSTPACWSARGRSTPTCAALAAAPLPRQAGFSFAEDAGDLTTAVHRCVGVGKCRADSTGSGGFMCPSYLATRDEKDSTRGRARVLQEMANGTLVSGGWSVARGARLAGPVPVLQGVLVGLPRGRRHGPVQVGGAVPYIPAAAASALALRARLAAALGPAGRGRAPAGQRAARIRPMAKAVLAGGGMDTRREIVLRPGAVPRSAAATLTPRVRAPPRRVRRGPRTGPGRPVVLWTDSFCDTFAPTVAQAAVAVLGHAGYEVLVPERTPAAGSPGSAPASWTARGAGWARCSASSARSR